MKSVEQKDATENRLEPEKEKVKKKKTRSRNKKKAIQDDDKENDNPKNNEIAGSSKQKPAKVVKDTAVEQEATAAKRMKSKKSNGKKKQIPVATKADSKEPLTEVSKELKQGEFTIDYDGLKDALGESFSLDDRQGPIHFAPLTSKAKIFHEKPLPKFSTSSAVPSRTSNRSTPTAKSKTY